MRFSLRLVKKCEKPFVANERGTKTATKNDLKPNKRAQNNVQCTYCYWSLEHYHFIFLFFLPCNKTPHMHETCKIYLFIFVILDATIKFTYSTAAEWLFKILCEPKYRKGVRLVLKKTRVHILAQLALTQMWKSLRLWLNVVCVYGYRNEYVNDENNSTHTHTPKPLSLHTQYFVCECFSFIASHTKKKGIIITCPQ